jgi:hypothetical protein
MLIQPTLDTLNRLKLHGMALALSEQMTHGAAQSLAFEERLAFLLEREELHRDNRRMTRLLAAREPEIPRRSTRGPRLPISQRAGSIPARRPGFLRLDPRQSKCPDPGRNRLRKNLLGVRARTSSLSPGLERAVRACTASVRGV